MAKHCNLILLVCVSVCLMGLPTVTCNAQEEFLRQLNPNRAESQSPVTRFGENSDVPSRLEGAKQLPPPPPPAWGDKAAGQMKEGQGIIDGMAGQLPPAPLPSGLLASGLSTPVPPPSAQFSSPTFSSAQHLGQVAGAQYSSIPLPPAHIDRGDSLDSGAYFYSTYSPARLDAARHAATQYRSQSSFGVPKIAELSATNADLVDQWIELALAINSISNKIVNAQGRLQSANRDYLDVSSKLQQNQTTLAIGQLLSHKRNQLEDWLVDGSSVHFLNDDVIHARQKQVESKLHGYDGKDVVRQTNEILVALRLDPNNVENAGVTSQIQSLLRERNEWLTQLKQGYNDYRHKLGDLDSISTAFSKLIADYRELIDRHVIWIRSNDALAFGDLQKAQTGLGSVFSSRRSLETGYSLRQKWKSDQAGG